MTFTSYELKHIRYALECCKQNTIKVIDTSGISLFEEALEESLGLSEVLIEKIDKLIRNEE